MRPFDVPSGVGNVISAAYCIPIGLVLIKKKPSAKAEISSIQNSVANVNPIKPGIDSTMPSNKNFLRLCCRSENGGMITAPSSPPISITAPSVPASVGVNPRGRMMFSTHVVTPLKIPKPINDTNKYSQNDFTVNAC